MSLITMGYAHATVITMGLGQSFRVQSNIILRPRQYGSVRFIDDTPEIEVIDEETEIKMTDMDDGIEMNPENTEVKYA